MKLLSYILLFIFCFTLLGRTVYSSTKKTHQYFSLKCSQENSDTDEEPETSDKKEEKEEKEESEKYIHITEHFIKKYNTSLSDTLGHTFINVSLKSCIKEIFIPPPEYA